MDDLTTSFEKNRGARIPQNMQTGMDQWSLELPPDANYADELMNYATIDEIIEGLPATSTEPSFATTDQPSEIQSQGTRPSTTATAKKGNDQKPRVVKEEERLRRAERQKRYRERQRQEEADAQNRVTETAIALERARVEQDSLLLHHTVLSKAVDYCTSSVQAAQAIVSSTISSVQTQYQSAVDGLAWLGLQVYTPSDAQLHAYIDKKNTIRLLCSFSQAFRINRKKIRNKNFCMNIALRKKCANTC